MQQIRQYTTAAWAWYRQQAQKMQIILAAVAVVLVCGTCGMLVNASGTPTPASTPAAQTTHTPTASKSQTPAKPTATPKPLTPVQQLTKIVKGATENSYTIKVEYGGDYGAGVVVVTEDIGDHATGPITIKSECFAVQHAIWSQFKGQLTQVNVNVTGPIKDQYGNTSSGVYAHTALNADTAHLFNWSNLDYASAWSAYDEAMIRSDL